MRIFAEEPPKQTPPQGRELGRLAEVLEAFRQATGWSLKYTAQNAPSQPSDLTWSAPATPGVGNTPGHLRLDSVGSTSSDLASRIDRDAAARLASALAGVLDELGQTRAALRSREAELATALSVPARPSDPGSLAARLQATLKAGAEAVDCRVAALYLLDEATTQLKLRAAWGLPPDRLTAPPRALQGCLADLEAMLGHAVVLEDTRLQAHFNAPEGFPAAVCVPVSTPTTILGTLWVFSDSERDFTERQTNVIELAAGRIAADLERETLLRESVDSDELKRQLAAAQRLQRNQLPTVPPLLDGWQVAGWTAQAETIGGDFFDWFGLPDGLIGVAVGDVIGRGIEAALSASTLKAALRSHGQYHREVDALLRQANLTLWRGAAGDQFAAVFCGLLETATGQVRYCCAGEPGIVLVRPGEWTSLSRPAPPLGHGPETDYPIHECTLQPGEALVVFTSGFRDAVDSDGRRLGERGLAEPMTTHLDDSAQSLVTLARRRLETHAAVPASEDRTVLVVKRTPS